MNDFFLTRCTFFTNGTWGLRFAREEAAKKYQPVRGAPAAGPMGRAVLVTGTPGVGKTTFAEELAALSGWKHVEVPLQIASSFSFARFGNISRSSSKNGEMMPNC